MLSAAGRNLAQLDLMSSTIEEQNAYQLLHKVYA